MNKTTEDALHGGNLRAITTYQAGVMQSSAHRILQKYCDTVLKPYGISKMQWLIIGTIRDAGPSGIRITELAKLLGTTLPYLTTTINTLQSKTILTRQENPKDNRAKFVAVNEAFLPQCDEIEETLRNALRKSIYREVSPKEFRTYMMVLHKLSQISE